jgi:NifU-like protein involved in Fe-S cluster formation
MGDNDVYDKYIDIFNQKKHMGKLEGPDVITADSYVSCADNIRIYIKAKEGIVSDAKYERVSCFVGVVVADLMMADIIGKPVSHLKEIDLPYVNKLMGVDVSSNFQMRGCAELPLSAIKEAIKKLKV